MSTPVKAITLAEVTINGAIEQAKCAYTLKNFELAVEHYASALELMYALRF